jgi:hypothetical protein
MPGGVPPGAIAERRLVDRLLRANAVSPAAGIALGDLRFVEQRRLAKLVTLGVIREEDGGRYYIFAPALAERMRSRRLRLAVVLMIVLLLMLAAAALTAPGIS